MDAFGTVVIAVAIIGLLGACASVAGRARAYREIGRGGLSIEDPALHPAPAPGTASYDEEAHAEIRQMLEAKSARREARGEAPLDVDAEVERLTAPPAADPELVRELRGHVEAANERRLRRNEAPLDVDAEVERRLRELTP